MKAQYKSVVSLVVSGADVVPHALIAGYARAANTYSDSARALVDSALAGFNVPVSGKGSFAVYPEALKFNTSEGKAYLKRDKVFSDFHTAVYKELKSSYMETLTDSTLSTEAKDKKADAHAADYRTALYKLMRAARAALLSGGAKAKDKVTKAKRGTKDAKKGMRELNIKDALAIWKRIAANEAPTKDDLVAQGLSKDILARYGMNTEGKKLGLTK
jgi:hypothetical protein